MSTRRSRIATGAFAATSTMGTAAVAGDHVGIAGFTIVAGLRAIFKGIGMYSAGHPQVLEHCNRLVVNLEPLFLDLECSDLGFVSIGRHFYVNGKPVRLSEAAAKEMAWFGELADRVGLVELRIQRGVRAADVAGLVTHLRQVDRAGQQIAQQRFDHIELFCVREDNAFEQLLAHLQHLPRFPLLVFYAEALGLVGQWVDQLAFGAQPESLAARRIIARAVDAMNRDPSGLIGLVTLGPMAGSPVNRRLDSALVAIAVGKQLGLADQHLLEIGATTLIRPVGFPREPWWERPPLDGKSAAEVAYRAETALEIIAGFEGAAPPGRVVPADYYGAEVQPHVATLIIAAASAYVDLLQPGESSNAFSPELALQLMLAQAGEFWEPTVVCAMAYGLGLYPPGTLVRLNSGDLAVVVRKPDPGSPLNRPIIRTVSSTAPKTFDLANSSMSAYKIAGSAQRSESELNPLYLFLA